MISNSTLSDFRESNIWKVMEAELKTWLNDIHFEMEDILSKNEDKTFHRLAGNAETVRRCLNIVDVLITNNNQEENDDGEDSKGI